MIYFKNTLSGKVEEFKSIVPHKVGMYNCGPTVYGKAHIGHARAYIFADLIKNVLVYNGYEVEQIINITDVGHLVADSDDGADKVEEQAKKERLDAKVITQKYTNDFIALLTTLNIDISEINFPKASDHVQEQIDFIQTLESKGFTYTTSDGVYFDTSKFPAYGELGHIDIKGLQEGARIESNSEKRNITDFSLWKFSKEPRQQEWESPWGIGFPGWHIECSAMAYKYLGTTFDIHTGGVDHIPTHHNNEIAQSVAAHDAPLANYWLHVNHIMIDGKKISKSIGNTLYLEDLETEKIKPADYKYLLYSAHYSTLLNFTFESAHAAKSARYILRNFLVQTKVEGQINQEYKKEFLLSINNDLNTAKAVALMFTLIKDKTITDGDKKATIIDFDRVLKLDLLNKELTNIPQEITDLAHRRKEARNNRDFALADALREKIEDMGYVIKDMDTEEGFSIESSV